MGVIAIPIIHTRKAIPLNSKQKKRIGFELSAYGGKNMMYRTELVEGITVENVIEKINAKIEEMEIRGKALARTSISFRIPLSMFFLTWIS